MLYGIKMIGVMSFVWGKRGKKVLKKYNDWLD